MLGQHAFETGAGHMFAPSIEEQLGGGSLATHSEPGAERFGDRFPQYKGTIAPSFAVHTDVDIGPVEVYIVEAEADEFRYTQATSERHDQHGTVANSTPYGRVGSVEKGVIFVAGEVPDKTLVRFLERNG